MERNKKYLFEKFETITAFRATLYFRICVVINIYFTVEIREKLPEYIYLWYKNAAYPLFIFNILLLVFYKKIFNAVQKYNFLLIFELSICIALIFLGGGWRSSYFGYCFSTLIMFTIFMNTKGAYISTTIVSVIAFLKNPAEGISAVDVFDVSNLDLRLGAATFFIVAGLVLGYFCKLVDRINLLSKQRMDDAVERTKIEQKVQLSFDLHDTIKSKISAILLLFKPLMKKIVMEDRQSEDDLFRLWKWLNYLQNETINLFESLNSTGDDKNLSTDLGILIKEEIRIVEDMTDFRWDFSANHSELFIPFHLKETIRRFISEATMNAWKHSDGKNGSILLTNQNGFITIAISDTGKGFDIDKIKDKKTSGIKSMRLRAEELGGKFTIHSAPGDGCRITLTFPV